MACVVQYKRCGTQARPGEYYSLCAKPGLSYHQASSMAVCAVGAEPLYRLRTAACPRNLSVPPGFRVWRLAFGVWRLAFG
eukprot:2891097-Rhodomonas_salina.1